MTPEEERLATIEARLAKALPLASQLEGPDYISKEVRADLRFLLERVASLSEDARLMFRPSLTQQHAEGRARDCGFPGDMAGDNAARYPHVTLPFPWRVETAGPDDAQIVCGGNDGEPFSRIAECHTADDARWIVAVSNAAAAALDRFAQPWPRKLARSSSGSVSPKET